MAYLSVNRTASCACGFPQIGRVLYLENSSNPLRGTLLEEAKAAAATLGIEIKPLDAGAAGGLDAALNGIRHTAADGILVAADLLCLADREKVARAVREARQSAAACRAHLSL